MPVGGSAIGRHGPDVDPRRPRAEVRHNRRRVVSGPDSGAMAAVLPADDEHVARPITAAGTARFSSPPRVNPALSERLTIASPTGQPGCLCLLDHPLAGCPAPVRLGTDNARTADITHQPGHQSPPIRRPCYPSSLVGVNLAIHPGSQPLRQREPPGRPTAPAATFRVSMPPRPPGPAASPGGSGCGQLGRVAATRGRWRSR